MRLPSRSVNRRLKNCSVVACTPVHVRNWVSLPCSSAHCVSGSSPRGHCRKLQSFPPHPPSHLQPWNLSALQRLPHVLTSMSPALRRTCNLGALTSSKVASATEDGGETIAACDSVHEETTQRRNARTSRATISSSLRARACKLQRSSSSTSDLPTYLATATTLVP